MKSIAEMSMEELAAVYGTIHWQSSLVITRTITS
jgi:hypothetical protein